MNERSTFRAPASVAQNIEKIVQVENEALQPRGGREAITDAVGGFVGTISFVVTQCLLFVAWTIVNSGTISQLTPFDPFPYPLLSSITGNGSDHPALSRLSDRCSPAPLGRMVILNDLEVDIELENGSVVNMRGEGRFLDFTLNMGLPSWRYELDGLVIEQ
jgi:hypothetical protein